MPRQHSVEKNARRISPILLVLAALCFLLPFVGVSCNTAAGAAALNGVISGTGSGGGFGSDSNGAASAQSCLAALGGHDLATYSGLNLVTGSEPSTATSVPGCSSTSTTPSTSANQGAIGVRPLLIAALVLMLAGFIAVVLRGPRRGVVIAGAALVAAVLIIADNMSVHSAILDRLASSSGSGSPSSLGLNGSLGLGSSLGTFLDVHAAIGFWLVLAALFLAAAVGATDALATQLSRRVPEPASGAPPPPPGSGQPPGLPPPPAPPPV